MRPPPVAVAAGRLSCVMATDPKKEEDPFDIALLGGKTEDGGGVQVVRLRPEGASIGEVRPLQEGRPIHGEVVQLKPREGAPWVCDVDVAVQAQQPAPPSLPSAERHGPAQVATATYRDNWERIFGRKKSPDDDLN